MITPLSEYTYFCFPESQVVRQFRYFTPKSTIGHDGSLLLEPLEEPLVVEMCRRFLLDRGHRLDELCGVWRYVFFMQFPPHRLCQV